jgi:sigma-B regulation protein RsbU (phosphoserine phosphatase)
LRPTSGPAAASRREPAIDAEHALGEWQSRVPASLRDGGGLPEHDVGRLFALADRVLRDASPRSLQELETLAYQIARRVLPALGLEPLLRYVRDDFLVVMTRQLAHGREGAPVALIAARVTDALWRAHADALQQMIQRQRDQSLEQELMLAKRIQQRLLPKSIPQIPGFDVAGRVLPALEVGGDYWSVKEYPADGIVTFKLADVTGHGIAAATLVAAVKFISGGFYQGAKTAAQVMERTNHVLVRETPSEIMVPMVYGWLYPLSKDVTLVNAGHHPVFVRRVDGRIEDIMPTGLVLGLMETRYAEIRIHLESGDLIFACSDGVAEPGAPRQLGVPAVKELVQRWAHEPAAVLVDRVLDEALRFYDHPVDDMSMIVVKRTE